MFFVNHEKIENSSGVLFFLWRKYFEFSKIVTDCTKEINCVPNSLILQYPVFCSSTFFRIGKFSPKFGVNYFFIMASFISFQSLGIQKLEVGIIPMELQNLRSTKLSLLVIPIKQLRFFKNLELISKAHRILKVVFNNIFVQQLKKTRMLSSLL